jgi:pimeloyl-ACP methyl ester carboxylesterase
LGLAVWLVGAALALGAPVRAKAAQDCVQVQRRVVSYSNVRLTVLDQGCGKAVVIIPSLGRGASDFDDLAARLAAAGFRVLRPEPRGIDGSTGPMAGLTMRDLASDVAQVITQSGLSQAVVVGHGAGNRAARATATYDPAVVSGVILIDAGGKIPADPEARTALRASFDPTLPPDVHLRMVATGFFAPGNDPSSWRGGWYPAVEAMEGGAGIATPVSEWWLAGTAPVLVIQGNQDRIAPPANADLLQREAGARVQVVRIDHAGHALVPEQPAAVASAMVAWLRGRE